MRKQYIFPYSGRPVEVGPGHGGLIRIDTVDLEGKITTAYFIKERLIKDLKDLIKTMEKYG